MLCDVVWMCERVVLQVLSLAQVVPVIPMAEYFRRQGLSSDDERLSQPDKIKEFLRSHEGGK